MKVTFQIFDEMTLNNIRVIWIPVWQWPAFLVFFIGIFILLFVTVFVIFLVLILKRTYLEDRRKLASITLSVSSFIYFIWFLVFTLVFVSSGTIYQSWNVVATNYMYDVGTWLIGMITFIPVFFLLFIGNLMWFLIQRKKAIK